MPASHEIHEARFAANPDDRVSFEFLEEHRFMQADWPGLADLYSRRQAAPSLASNPRQRAEIGMRLAQICEERLGDADAAIVAYTEAVKLEPKLRRALRQLRRIYEARGSWEAVLQLGEQEATLAESAEERARAFVVMADVWQRHLGDAEQAEQLYARARSEGWSDPRAPRASRSEPKASEGHQVGSRSEPKASEADRVDERNRSDVPAPATAWPVPAPPLPAAPMSTKPKSAELANPFGDDEFEFYPDLECDLEVDDAAENAVEDLPIAAEPVRTYEPQITMPDLEPAALPASAQRTSRVLGVLERKLAERESRGAGLDAESIHLRLRIAELRAGALADPIAAIAALEPALESPEALIEVAPTLAGLYEQLGRSEPLFDLAERAAEAAQPREQRVFWLRRAADAARAAGAAPRAIDCYRRLLADLPHDHGARAALGDLYRSRGDAGPLVGLLREELPRVDRDRELELQRELASLVAEGLGDPIGAIPHLRRCLELEPERSDLLERALSACALQGGPFAQLDLVEHACDSAERDTVRAALLARRGTLLADALQWNEEAAASWRAALALDPDQPVARARLARA